MIKKMENLIYSPSFAQWSRLAMALLIVGLSMVDSSNAYAVKINNAGELGDYWASQFSGLAGALKAGAALIGLGLLVVGIIMAANAKKAQTPMTIPIIMALCGFGLLGIGTVAMIGTASLTGTDEASSAMGDLGL